MSLGNTTYTGSATNIGTTLVTIISPVDIRNCRRWSATIKNTGVNITARVQVEMSNDPTNTAASITDWFDINNDIPDGSTAVVIPNSLPATGAALSIGMFSPALVSTEGKWVRVRARANNAARTSVRGRLHCINKL